jgi:phosphatidylserine decarboxylase
VEQVKGLTYSLDALLGKSTPTSPTSQTIAFANRDHEIVNDQEFANMNGIDYSLDQLFGSKNPEAERACGDETPRHAGEQHDVSVPHNADAATISHDASVAMAVGPPPLQRSATGPQVHPHTKLYFTVIYLAPGDYHRFHSPAAWVVERRRHFAGELFSVSPWMARRLQNLFVLNERVALLGRWRHGFFGMVPVGATNVGSIILNFDRELRTNLRRGRARSTEPGTYVEAVYSNASSVLKGQPLRPGEEMGGFCLGSTVVLVFEAPRGFEFNVKAGEKVKVGQKLGDVKKEE